jgi:hypothetical protein
MSSRRAGGPDPAIALHRIPVSFVSEGFSLHLTFAICSGISAEWRGGPAMDPGFISARALPNAVTLDLLDASDHVSVPNDVIENTILP